MGLLVGKLRGWLDPTEYVEHGGIRYIKCDYLHSPPEANRCDKCEGHGWDADWGGVFDCDACGGSGSTNGYWIRTPHY